MESMSEVKVVAEGAAKDPEVLAKIVLFAILARAIVPEAVIGPPVNPVPVETLVTVPPPPGVPQLRVPEPFVCKTWLGVPSAEGKVQMTLVGVAGA